MTPERWRHVRGVLDDCLQLEVERRAEYLQRACQGDPDLRREVESLLVSYEEATDILEAPALHAGAEVVVRALDGIAAPSRIGHYKIIGEIGRGGMGTVYRAERDDGHFRKQVAIKLVNRGLASDFVVRRFRHERQIMAGLEHPNIARLLDGGSTEDGLPYFVMEYIEGLPIDVYCDKHRLTTAERLRLFRTVCLAVQYAHGKLVIHRDIKPGNILIAEDGVPKLLDFGIAKILDPALSMPTAEPGVTVLRLMTPEYASPEQVRGHPITEATDVYSLGVLLYELLTGHRPYRVDSRAPHEMARAICEAEPEKPSTIVRRVKEVTPPGGDSPVRVTPEQVSAARRSRPDKLRRTLAGDLDNIVLTAMRKEPHRRYASVEDLSEDIRRYLEGLPVTARKDTFVYRTGKVFERHRAAVISAVVAGAVLLGMLALVRDYGGSSHAVLSEVIPFTSFPGNETQPSFSPDGRHIAFVWSGEDNSNQDIYIRPVAGGELVRITTDPARDDSPAWSRDGRFIAFLRTHRKETAIFVGPAGKGTHRKVADVYPTRVEAAGVDALGRPVDWSPDGRFLAIGDKNSAEEPFSIYLISVDSGAKQKVTYPPDRTIGDSNPAFSPDGRHLCFIRAPSSGVTDLWVMALAGGEPRRLTFDNRDILSAAWTRDGRAIVFASNRTGSYNLWRVAAGGGTPERLPGIGPGASDPSFTRDGSRMAFAQFFLDTNIWRLEIERHEAARPPRKLIVSTQYDSSAQFSPDGNRVAFRSSRSGNHEIWVADSEGLRAVQLTNFGGPLTGTPRWSPDGRWIACDSRPGGQADIYVISAEGGEPRRLTINPAEDVVPSWSRDGRWIYFASNRSGAWQVWRMPAEGGVAEKVTQLGGFAAFESLDGTYLYYAKGRSVGGLWRMPVGGGQETPVLEQLRPGFWGYWALARDGLYFVDQSQAGPGQWAIFFQGFGARKPVEVAPIERRPVVGDSAFALSPDGRYILYTQIDQSGSDIMVANLTGG